MAADFFFRRPHGGWLDMAKPFISAYHAGATSPDSYITHDQLIYWYRPNPRTLNCDSTDTTMVPANNGSGNYFMGRPDGWEDMQDSVFVVAMLTKPGSLTIASGNNVKSFSAPAGASVYTVDMALGKQQFFLVRDGTTVLSAVSLKDITDVCPCGIYNFNAYVGTVPESPPDPLQRDGLFSLTMGLHVSTCTATPSLGTAPITPTMVPPGGGGPGPTTTSTGATTSTTGGSTSTPTSTSTTPATSPTTTSMTSTTSTPVTTGPTTTTNPATTTTGTGGTCIGGTGPGNYVGLCSFCCNFGYCPPGPCTCTAYGAPIPTPPTVADDGRPLPGEDDSYLGLCSFACNHGYCPPTACQKI